MFPDLPPHTAFSRLQNVFKTSAETYGRFEGKLKDLLKTSLIHLLC